MLHNHDEIPSDPFRSIGLSSHYVEDTIYVVGEVARRLGPVPATYAFRAPFQTLMDAVTKDVGAAYRMRRNPGSYAGVQTLVAVIRLSDPDKAPAFLAAFRQVWDAAEWAGQLKWADTVAGTEQTRDGVEAYELFRPKGSGEFAAWRSGIGKPPARGALEV